jgi:hypothetical protein
MDLSYSFIHFDRVSHQYFNICVHSHITLKKKGSLEKCKKRRAAISFHLPPLLLISGRLVIPRRPPLVETNKEKGGGLPLSLTGPYARATLSFMLNNRSDKLNHNAALQPSER